MRRTGLSPARPRPASPTASRRRPSIPHARAAALARPDDRAESPKWTGCSRRDAAASRSTSGRRRSSRRDAGACRPRLTPSSSKCDRLAVDGPAGRLAGPLRADERAAAVPQRALLGHRALGADLMAAAAEVVLPRPVAALAPVALPAPVASRADAAPGRSGPAPPRPAGGWARPDVGHSAAMAAPWHRTAPTAPVAEHQPSRGVRRPGRALDAGPAPVDRDVDLPRRPVRSSRSRACPTGGPPSRLLDRR